ncbi:MULTISPECIES: helix-turn-helix domain-containing protein [Mycobacteriales]|uniref:helix-turn-helix domain-containing protein n=1 Tax=Mycobacteriales TaxID=85007 RepID=UPI000587A957|nr:MULTISPECIES: XRE family transcriptional regulator [Mycobacteriales]MCM3898065.1 XRE family transcriptional regulator [Gordonia sputi]NKY95838.1 helix-turn-helix domain-containing protein [Gordonia sputi]OBA35123.1 XRE family transcriptional regulator [Gordonia sp. 852002-51296_SCH5728562-b]UEA61113.1 XRE family transcriptional regulator [Gordonia otitidis]
MDDDDQAILARSLGSSIRAARKSAGLTLSALATSTDLSQPFLSQVENGNTTPSVINLHRIAQTLGTTAHDLLEQSNRIPVKVVRNGEARRYNLGPDAVVRFCVGGTRLMDCNEVTAEPHSSAEAATSHAGEEFVYVVMGEVRLNIGGQSVVLRSGDTVYYSASVQHQWFNDTDETAVFLFVGTPPSF